MTDFQLFPSLEPAVEAALRESIQRFGVLVPVIIDQDDRILDGYNRQRIASELGVECPWHQVHVRDDDHARELAQTMNMDRRHLDVEQRREIVAALRATGHSLRAIAGAVGISKSQVANDLEDCPPLDNPTRVTRQGGGTYPATRPPGDRGPQVICEQCGTLEGDHADWRCPDCGFVWDSINGEDCGNCGREQPAEWISHLPLIPPEEMAAILDELEEAHGDDLTDEIIDQAIEDNLDSKRTPKPISKPDVGGGVSHPARYSDGLLPIFADQLDGFWRVLDPFAGTGRIHLLEEDGFETTGVEIEQPWADLHDRTIHANALDMPFKDGSFDSICTSPTYGNRLSDHHEASDPDERRTYRHDLGRALHEDNSGQLHWGPKYRAFHEQAWPEAVRVLRPGGRFVLNIKDHIRDGHPQPVSGWHVTILTRLGLDLLWMIPVATPGLRYGANREARIEHEWVLVFDRPEEKP